MGNARGQVLAAVLMVLLIVATLTPLMVYCAQREAVWTHKVARSTTAFHLAEAGLEKAYFSLSDPERWAAVQSGTALPHFHFDLAFSDVRGGSYTVSISSGPGAHQATVVSVGRDALSREIRALTAVYDDAQLEDTMLYSGGAVDLSGNVDVEWGAVASGSSIQTGGMLHPQFWSAAAVLPYDSSASPPNCDAPSCCQWHSYDAALPPPPLVDLSLYRSSAAATGTFYASSASWTNVTDWGNKTFYVSTDLTIGSPGIDIIGNVIVLGDLSSANGTFGKGTHAMPVPRTAWKQYCNDWSTYLSYDPGAPAAFPGLSSPYLSAPALTYLSRKLAVQGLLYVGGNFTVGGGGGQTDINGAMYVVGQSTMTSGSHVTLYFNADAAAGLTSSKIELSRASWRETLTPWPSGL